MIELISIHIHKTGGCSLLRALRYVYGSEEPFTPYTLLGIRPERDYLLYTDYDARKMAWDEAMKRVPKHVRVLQDHMPVQLFDGLFPNAKRIVWLRNPVHRVISAYIYDLTKGLIERDCDIRQFITRDRERNVMTFFTAGGDLEQFFFVGMLEDFAQDLAHLADLLGWPLGFPIAHDHQCRRPNLKEEFLSDPGLTSEIEALNCLDCELYDRFRRQQK